MHNSSIFVQGNAIEKIETLQLANYYSCSFIFIFKKQTNNLQHLEFIFQKKRRQFYKYFC